jgi:hypothetical protein
MEQAKKDLHTNCYNWLYIFSNQSMNLKNSANPIIPAR